MYNSNLDQLKQDVIDNYYTEAVLNAQELLGIPPDMKIDREALIMALLYEGDLRYMIDNTKVVAEMGLPNPIINGLSASFPDWIRTIVLRLKVLFTNPDISVISAKEWSSLMNQLNSKVNPKEVEKRIIKIVANWILQNVTVCENTEIAEVAAQCYLQLISLQVVDGNDMEIIQKLVSSISELGRVSLLQFNCPDVDYTYFTDSESAPYLQFLGRTSLIARQIKTLSAVYNSVEADSLKPAVLNLIGDDDLLYLSQPYILKALQEKTGKEVNEVADIVINGNFPVCSPNPQREMLRQQTEAILKRGRMDKKPLELLPDPTVISLGDRGYEIDGVDLYNEVFLPVTQNPLEVKDSSTGEDIFIQEDIDREVERMRELFDPQGGFYASLINAVGRPPTEQELIEIVYYKFAIYAMQGVLANSYSQNLILIQNETPAKLRDKMLNAGLRMLGLPTIPSIYLYNNKNEQ
jgi:hypothetical protein